MSNTEPAQCAGPQLDVKKPTLALPPNAADCHCHVFGPRDKYPWAANRLYTPPPVSLDDYLAMLDATGFERGVLVQTGLYGTDNRFIVDAMKAHPRPAARHRADRRGHHRRAAARSRRQRRARLPRQPYRQDRPCSSTWRGGSPSAPRSSAGTCSSCSMSRIIPISIRLLGSFATEVVIDHMGRPDPGKGIDAPGFQALIRLLKSGRGWAKLSAPYRTSLQPPPYADITPFAHALVEAAPDRLVWGSDWPHVLLETEMPNDGDLVDQIAVWVPDEATRSASWSTTRSGSTASAVPLTLQRRTARRSNDRGRISVKLLSFPRRKCIGGASNENSLVLAAIRCWRRASPAAFAQNFS